MLSCKYKVKDEILKKLKQASQEYNALPVARTSDVEKQNLFKARLNKVIKHFDNLVHGRYEDFTDNKNMNLRARIDEIFEEHHQELEQTQDDFLSEKFLRNLQERILEDRGVNLPNFLNQEILCHEVKLKINEQGNKSGILAIKVKEKVE